MPFVPLGTSYAELRPDIEVHGVRGLCASGWEVSAGYLLFLEGQESLIKIERCNFSYTIEFSQFFFFVLFFFFGLFFPFFKKKVD